MANKRFLEIAERQKNHSLPVEKILTHPKSRSPTAIQNTNFPDLPSESFLMSYDGTHGAYFQELISKVNEVYSGTRAEIPIGTSGEVQNMYAIKRMALVSTIANNSSLQNQGFYPINPMQSESLLKAGKLPDPSKYWEDLALLLYDTNGRNLKEAQALKESIIQHRTDLGLSQSDLEKRLVVVSAGGEVDSSMPHGVKPIIIPGITQVYHHEVLEKVGENISFNGYGLNGGLPLFNQLGRGDRTLYMPDETSDIGLRVLYRYWDLDLDARDDDLASSNSDGRVTFAPQGRVSKK